MLHNHTFISITIAFAVGFVVLFRFLGLRKTETWKDDENERQRKLSSIRRLHIFIAIVAVAYGFAITSDTLWPVHILVGPLVGWPIGTVWAGIRIKHALLQRVSDNTSTNHSIIPSPAWVDCIFIGGCLGLGMFLGNTYNFL